MTVVFFNSAVGRFDTPCFLLIFWWCRQHACQHCISLRTDPVNSWKCCFWYASKDVHMKIPSKTNVKTGTFTQDKSSISIPMKLSHKMLLLVPTFPSNEMFWNVTPVATFHSGGEYGAVKKHVNCVVSPARFLRACQYGGAIQGHTNVIWLSASNSWCNYLASRKTWYNSNFLQSINQHFKDVSTSLKFSRLNGELDTKMTL